MKWYNGNRPCTRAFSTVIGLQIAIILLDGPNMRTLLLHVTAWKTLPKVCKLGQQKVRSMTRTARIMDVRIVRGSKVRRDVCSRKTLGNEMKIRIRVFDSGKF